jgi:LacI family transcriptional regulator
MIDTKRAVTVIDVAKAAGVLKSTVSLVIRGSDKVSDRAKEAVKKAIKQTGYVYNREAAAMRSKSSELVAIVINDLTNPYSAQLAVALENQVRKRGLMTMLVNSAENVDTQTELVEKLAQYRLKAYIICPAPNTEGAWLNELAQGKSQVITMMRQVSGADVPCVLPDNETGTYLATKALLEKGRRHFAFIGGDDSISDYHQRLAGVQKAVNEYSVTVKVVNSATNRQGGRLAITECLSSFPELDAVVCFNDIVAYGVMEHLTATGVKIGEEVSVVGFDDLSDSAWMQVPLSTVRIDADKIAHAVCGFLDEPNSAQVEQVDVELMMRAS